MKKQIAVLILSTTLVACEAVQRRSEGVRESVDATANPDIFYFELKRDKREGNKVDFLQWKCAGDGCPEGDNQPEIE